jgi:hypothetical protein
MSSVVFTFIFSLHTSFKYANARYSRTYHFVRRRLWARPVRVQAGDLAAARPSSVLEVSSSATSRERPESSSPADPWSFDDARHGGVKQRLSEATGVQWMNEGDVVACTRCLTTKFSLLVRRHHCRFCGCVHQPSDPRLHGQPSLAPPRYITQGIGVFALISTMGFPHCYLSTTSISCSDSGAYVTLTLFFLSSPHIHFCVFPLLCVHGTLYDYSATWCVTHARVVVCTSRPPTQRSEHATCASLLTPSGGRRRLPD